MSAYRLAPVREDGAEHKEGAGPLMNEECPGVQRVERAEDRRRDEDPTDPEHREGQEPEQRQWTEQTSDAAGPDSLHGEEADEDQDRHRQDKGPEPGCGDLEPSTALRTVTAGVIMLSPRRSARAAGTEHHQRHPAAVGHPTR
jgi:hypothetical protein